MKSYRFLPLMLSFIVVALFLFACNTDRGSVNGMVTEEDGTPIVNAEVALGTEGETGSCVTFTFLKVEINDELTRDFTLPNGCNE